MKLGDALPLHVRARDGTVYCVPAWGLTSERFPGVEFAVHKSLDRTDRWTVTEVSTGLMIAQGRFEATAISCAAEALRGTTPEALEAAIRRELSRLDGRGVPPEARARSSARAALERIFTPEKSGRRADGR